MRPSSRKLQPFRDPNGYILKLLSVEKSPLWW